jgi:hypothetical protein
MSIEQRLHSEVYKLANQAVTPDQIKAVQSHVVKSVQDGALPSYIGVPILSDLNQKMSNMQQAQAMSNQMVNQPPVAQQVMQQAQQDAAPGVQALPSNLPTQAMAEGGIINFAMGGDPEDYFDDDREQTIEDEEEDEFENALNNLENPEDFEQVAQPSGISGLNYSSQTYATKAPGEKEHGIKHEEMKSVGNRGLEDLLKTVEHQESRGRDYDKNGNLLTSSAGAQGRMQVMPATARDPGFGIRPAKEGDTEDLARVGKELYTKMLDRYKDPKLAAAAYNWGAGNVDKWIMAGADPAKLPEETRNYIKPFAEGGITHFVTGDQVVGPFQSESDQLLAEARARAAARAAANSLPATSAEAAPAAAEAGVPSLWNAIKSGVSRMSPGAAPAAWGIGLGTYSPELNANEEQDLQRYRNKGNLRTTNPDVVTRQQNAPTHIAAQSKQTQDQSGNPLMYMPDSNSYMNASDYFNTPAPEGNKTAEAPEQTAKSGGIDELFGKYQANLEHQHDINAYLGLLSAGLGMMGGSSPYAFQNIGKGAQQGLGTYMGLEQQAGEEQKGLLNAQIAAENAKARNAYYNAALEERKRAAQASEATKGERADLAHEKLYSDQFGNLQKYYQNKAMAEYKGQVLPEQKDAAFAKAEMEMRKDPAYIDLYRKVYKMDPPGLQSQQGMSPERAGQFSVVR